MVLRIILIFCAVLALICFCFGARAKRKNIGFIVYAIMVMECQMACYMVLGSRSIGMTKKILPIYYILYAWLYFAALVMILIMSRAKKSMFLIIPSGIISSFQTALMLSNFLGKPIIAFSKRVLLGQSWWITEKAGSSPFWNFGMYRGLLFLNSLLIIGAAFIGMFHIARAFRGKFFLIIGYEVAYAVLEFFSQKYYWPAWILSLVLTPACIVMLYIVAYYPNVKLRNWSLMMFADDLSDGCIIYNEYNDLIYANDVLKRIFPEELLNEFKDIRKLNQWLAGVVDVEGFEVVICGNETGEYYFKAHKTEISEKGHFLGTIYMLHDTTDSILRLSTMKEANTELERAARMKSDFLANMSHEIRTPMNAVIGMAELALREELSPTVTDYLKQIQSSGKNLLNIINDILDFSKIEAGKMEITTEDYEPLSEINDIANILVNRIGEKDIELYVTNDVTVPYKLCGDAMRIRQIIINLAGNAIKFTKEGFVFINLTCEKISDDEVMLTYHVIDTGQGIREADIDKLFTSFQQVDSKRNRSVEGTGLGLAISKRLCEAMNGSIGVKSEYGVGSDFYFSIPQKIVDGRNSIQVKDADSIHAFVLNENERMVEMLFKDINMLGAHPHSLRTLDDYKPTEGKDFVFFIEQMYGEDLRDFLNRYPECTGVILVDFDSAFIPDLPNLAVMKRPESTLNLSLVLNGEKILDRAENAEGVFQIDFKAPSARFLIVDDNEINIKIAKGLIGPLESECVGAISGKEAIEKVSKEQFDIIFMDHMMPEMDGIEATHIIRETIPGGDKIPIIALTANVMEGVRDMFIQEGMSDFVAKPIYVKDLIRKIKQWIPEEKIIALSEYEIAKLYKETGKCVRFDCLDNKKAIETLGSSALFEKVVGEYYKAGEGKKEALQTSYDNEDWDSYIIKIHALKSASRQIGAFEVGELAWQLEKAGKDRDIEYIRTYHSIFIDLYEKLLDKLSKYFPEEEVDESLLKEFDISAVKEMFEKLAEACDNLDMDAMEDIEKDLKEFKYPEELKADMKNLYTAIEEMDGDRCKEIMEGLGKVN